MDDNVLIKNEEKKPIGFLVILILFLLALSFVLSSISPSDELSISFVSGTEYLVGEDGQIIIELRDRQFDPVNAICDVTIFYPDKTYFVDHVLMSSSTFVGTKYYDFVIPQVHGVYEYSVNCSLAGRNYVVGKSFHVSESDAVFTELIGVEVAGIEDIFRGGTGDVVWRINTGRVCNLSCSEGSESWDNKSATCSWDSSNYSVGSVMEIDCNLSVTWDRSFTLFSGVSTTCYQEFANETPSNCPCGGSGDGTYDVQNKYIYVNYTKPVGALPSSKWVVKFGWEYNSINLSWAPFERNISIPLSCWNFDSNKLALRMYSLEGFSTTNASGECYNGTNWERITPMSYSTPSSPPPLWNANTSYLAFDGNWSTHTVYRGNVIATWYEYGLAASVEKGYWYEEAMLWNIYAKQIELKHFINVYKGVGVWIAK